MPLSVDNVVHENSGAVTTAGTSHVVSLAGTDSTSAGNTVLVFVKTSAGSVTGPAGFVLDLTSATLQVLRKSDVAAGETSWTFTTALNNFSEWYVVELSGVDLVEPLDVSVTAGPTSVSNGGTLSTGTTPLNAGLNTVVFAAFSATKSASTESWSGYTNGFEEVADLDSAGANLAVARKFVTGTTGTFSCTATLATTQASTGCYALVVAYRSADSPIVAPLHVFAGFEWGTHGGITAAGAPANMLGTLIAGAGGTWGTNHLIQASSARNSSYGLRIVCSASAAWVRIGNFAAGAGIKAATYGFDVQVVSSTGTVVVAEVLDSGGATRAQVVYDTATTKFGVRAGTTGTISYESGTTAANTWRWIDLRVNTATTTHTVDWRIETGANTYTDQAQASLSGQSSGVAQLMFAPGRQTTTQTATFDFDNVVLSSYFSAFPLGPHVVKLLTVDPAGTPSVSGTSTNFSVFTANGTLGAWNAVNARNAMDEVPPTISASADGVTQTAAAASDYMEFPMATYTLAATETCVGVRMLAPLWSGTGAGAGDLAIRGWDGTSETALATASQITPGSGTAVSSTVPVWRCAMWQSVNGWTQAELDAAALRVGFSADATPDMGVHAAYLEIAVGKTKTVQALGDVASAEYDPNRGGMVSATATAPVDAGTTMRWTDAGGSGSQAVSAGGSFTHQSNATFADEVTVLEVESDPEQADRY